MARYGRRQRFGFCCSACALFVVCVACKREAEPAYPPANYPPAYGPPVAYAPAPAYAAAPAYGPTMPPAPAPAPPPPAPTSSDPWQAVRTRCVDLTNAYRARVGAAPVARATNQEACSDGQARSDGASRSAHGAFGQCGESAQNECPAWNGAASEVLERCLAMMFAEGPGSGAAHGHYNNMTERAYRSVACGFTTLPNGDVWIVQNFFR